MTQKIWKIVLTGGPCSGKTTSLASIYEKFGQEIDIVAIPETATMTFKAGIKINPETYTFEELVTFTKELIKMQIHIETYFENLAKLSKRPTLLVCDRGACDTFAYCSDEVREQVLKEEAWDFNFLSLNRYDMIIHLVTSANGAPEFYDLNNEARFESIEQAIKTDNQIQKVWMKHPNFTIIDNSEKGFLKKLTRVFNRVGHFLNIPERNVVKKYLLERQISEIDFPSEMSVSTYLEEIVYLKPTLAGRIDFIVKKVILLEIIIRQQRGLFLQVQKYVRKRGGSSRNESAH
jgi:hypothetical protein